ncbi:hypothetical protein, partial [Burkholderia vietnamiensis]|uniref:hypothetical protein n=1 Tax=Burkholderia vietnamiensis TaxID=60552 RepID=UPI002DD41DCE
AADCRKRRRAALDGVSAGCDGAGRPSPSGAREAARPGSADEESDRSVNMSSARSMRDGRGKAARAGPVVRERARSGPRSNSGAAQQRRRRACAEHSAGVALRGRIRALDGGTLTRCWQRADEAATNTGSRHRTRHIDRRSRAGRVALHAHRARHRFAPSRCTRM